MAGHEDTFFAVGADGDVAALAGDLRPAFVFDRSGTRLLWANAAGLASLGADPKTLLLRHYPSSSPLARRISVVAGQLVAGQTRTDRIPLPRGLVPAPVLCRVTRVAAGDHRGVLVVDMETKPVFPSADAARAAYEAILRVLVPAEAAAPEAPTAEDVPAAQADAPVLDAPESGVDERDAVRDEVVPDQPPITPDTAEHDPGAPESDEPAEETPVPTVSSHDTAVADEPGPTESGPADLDSDWGPAGGNANSVPAEDDGLEPGEPLAYGAFAAETAVGQTVGDERDSEEDGAQAAGAVAGAAFDIVPDGEAPSPAPDDGSPDPARTSAEAAIEDTEAGEERPTFVFPSHGRSVRFVFELAGDLAFSFLSPELEETVGPAVTPHIGEGWPSLSDRLDLDPSGRVLAALGRHDTFTGLTVDWPVSDQALRVPVDLAGMPVFSRERRFLGYRGFGIAKTGAAFTVAAEPSSAGILAFVPRPTDPDGSGDLSAAEAPALVDEPVTLIETEADAGVVPEPDAASAADAADRVYASDEQEPAPASPEPAYHDPEPGWAIEEDAIASEEAPALVVDVETELVIEPPLAEDEAESERSSFAPDAETLSAAEARLYAFPQPAPADDDDLSSAVDAEALPTVDGGLPIAGEADASEPEAPDEEEVWRGTDEGAGDEHPFAEPVDAVPADHGEAELEGDGRDFSSDAEALDDQPADDALATLPDEDDDAGPDFAGLNASPLPDEADEAAPVWDDAPAVDDHAPAPIDGWDAAEADGPPDETAIAIDDDATPVADDLDWRERRGEIIPSPVVARPIPPQADLSPEEFARRQLSRPEREAFEKIAEALGARVEENAFGPRSGEHDVMRVAAPVPKPAAEPMVPIDSAVLDRLPIAMAILRDGDAVLVNRAFLDLSGYASLADLEAEGGFAEAFVGSPVARQGALPAIRQREGGIVPVEAKLHSVSYGGGMASLIVVQPINREAAPPFAAQTVGLASGPQDGDVRARELEAILDTATDGVLVIDERGAIVGANRSAEALFGSETEAMLGAPLVDLLAPESHRAALDYLDGLARNGVASVLNDGREVIGRVQQGGLVPLFMTMGRVSPGRFCAVLRDITQWKRAEEELTTAKRSAENASSQKSDFLAKISHEIRTPLNAIIGFSEVMMEERFGPVGSERYKEYLRDIHQSGTLIMSLVNDLLDLSKIEAGKLDLSFESVVLNDVVRDCVALMQPQANRERVIIRTSLSSSVPNVVADPRSLRQIVLNLLSNAIKFNSAGGQVIVSTIYEDTGEVVIRVRDTGPGMSAEDVERALEPFRQLHTSRPVRGTGLGLPLTKALVEANRAAFRIDSSLGQGTLVQITFPTTRVLAE